MKKILIIKPSSLGDIIHALPVLPLIRAKYPDAHISWLVNDSFAGIVDLFPEVDQIIVFKRKRWGQLRHTGELLSFLWGLRQYKFDLVIDLQGLLRSGIFAWATKAEQRIGFDNAREGARYFYSERVLLPSNLQHAVDKNMFLVKSVLSVSEDVQPICLKELPDFMAKRQELFATHGIAEDKLVICVAPVARWKSKSCSPDFFAQVIGHLKAAMPELEVCLVGTTSERPAGERIMEKCSQWTLHNLMGETDLGTLVECLRKAEILITNDSGPMHIAAALGTSTAVVFGPTSAELTGPYGDNHLVFTGECEFRPCRSRECPKKVQTCLNVDSEMFAERILAKIRKDGV